MMAAAALLGVTPGGSRPGAALGLDFSLLASRFGGEAESLDEEGLQALIELARDGDRIAGQRLYRQLVDRVYRTVRPLLLSDAEAEDVTQDAMLTLLTSLARYQRREGARFAAWALTIAVNTARRRYRRQRPEPADPLTFDARADASLATDEALDREERRAALLRALGELPERERRVVSLRYGGELKASEIAVITGLSAANVRKLLERSRQKLAERLAELRCGDEP